MATYSGVHVIKNRIVSRAKSNGMLLNIEATSKESMHLFGLTVSPRMMRSHSRLVNCFTVGLLYQNRHFTHLYVLQVVCLSSFLISDYSLDIISIGHSMKFSSMSG